MYQSGTANYDKFMPRHQHVSDKGKLKRTTDVVDIAARYLVYKVFDAISGTPETWRPLGDIDEKIEILTRAVERGWVMVLEHQQEGRPTVRVVALTDEGRRMARRSLH